MGLLPAALALAGGLSGCAQGRRPARPHDPEAVDAEARRAMAATGARGLALAIIDAGRVRHVAAFGARNARGDPLTPSTVMYGASLTKAVFAWCVLQWVDEGRLGLDDRLDALFPNPLPDYGNVPGSADWGALAGDERWRRLTPRLLLSHRSGFANFGFLEPDGRLRFHFEPGARYGYSGDGYQLLQFALEQGLKLDVGAEIQRRVFDRLGMARTAMTWRADFADNVADGWTLAGAAEPHARRSRVRAAGSMDTTIADFARFAAAVAAGDGLSPAMQAVWWTPQAPLTTATQFPTLQPELPAAQRRPGRHTGLGTILFDGPQGPGQYKGGHDERTGNTWVTLRRGARAVVLLSNDVRAESAYPGLVRAVLGDTGAPWDWEYGPQAVGG